MLNAYLSMLFILGMAAVGSDAICGMAAATFVDVAAVTVAVVAAGVAAVGPDAICGTVAAAWFHVVDYACSFVLVDGWKWICKCGLRADWLSFLSQW
jgi:hypothetical protein